MRLDTYEPTALGEQPHAGEPGDPDNQHHVALGTASLPLSVDPEAWQDDIVSHNLQSTGVVQ